MKDSIRAICRFQAFLALLLWLFPSAPTLATGIFYNASPIVFLPGKGSLYPSNINVSGLVGTVTKVTVSLYRFSHNPTDGVVIVLQGPEGDMAKLMLDSGDGRATNITLTFDDAASSEIPMGSIVYSGVYKPASGGALSSLCSPMPSPAPQPPYSSALSVFNGKNPNGIWKLYVCDKYTGDTGAISGGWSIRFEGADAGNLESLSTGSFESGIGLIRGWACEAGRIEAIIDGTTSIELPYGTSRPDTLAVCGNDNNGFGGVINWNRIGDGLHEIQAYRDGVLFASASFHVTTLGVEYLTGASADFYEALFPDASRNVTLHWSEPHQNFVFGGGGGSGNPADTQGDGVSVWLESPFSGSAESGIGLIRGWACDASTISVVIDDDPAVQAAYGADRPDTAAICGDSDNGFGIVVNWNRYVTGSHWLRVFKDGATTPFADVTFNVYNIGVEYLSGIGSPSRILSDFPTPGSSTTVTWSESHQNVVITGHSP